VLAVLFHAFEAIVGIVVIIRILRMMQLDRDINKKYKEEIQAKLDAHICDAESRFDELNKEN